MAQKLSQKEFEKRLADVSAAYEGQGIAPPPELNLTQTRQAWEEDQPVMSPAGDFDPGPLALEQPTEPGYMPGETVMSPEDIEAAKIARAEPSTQDPGILQRIFGIEPQEDEEKYFNPATLEGGTAPLEMNLSGEYPETTPLPGEDAGAGRLVTDSQSSEEQRRAAAQRAGGADAPAPGGPGYASIFGKSPYADELKTKYNVLDDRLREIGGMPDEISPLLDEQEKGYLELKKRRQLNEMRLNAAQKLLDRPYESFWARRSTGQKIASAIALALGTIGGGLSLTGKNSAAEIIIDAANEDARLQRADRRERYQGQKDRFESFRRMIGDDQAALDFRIASNIKKARLKIDQAKARAVTAEQRMKLVSTQHSLWLKEKELMAKAVKALDKLNPSQRYYTKDKYGMEVKKPEWKTWDQGGTKAFATSPTGKELKSGEATKFNLARQGARNVVRIKMLLEKGVSPNIIGSWPSEYNHALKLASEAYGRIYSGAAIGKEEGEKFEGFFPGWMSEMLDEGKDVGDFKSHVMNKLLSSDRNVRDTFINEMWNTFNSYGTDLTGAGFDESVLRKSIDGKKTTSGGYTRHD
jgi:hypothetical protein